MFVMALIVVFGIMYGMSGRNVYRYKAIGAEARILERKNCYKLSELRVIEPVQKVSVSEKLIHGVLKHGGIKSGVLSVKKAQREPNCVWKYSYRHAGN